MILLCCGLLCASCSRLRRIRQSTGTYALSRNIFIKSRCPFDTLYFSCARDSLLFSCRTEGGKYANLRGWKMFYLVDTLRFSLVFSVCFPCPIRSAKLLFLAVFLLFCKNSLSYFILVLPSICFCQDINWFIPREFFKNNMGIFLEYTENIPFYPCFSCIIIHYFLRMRLFVAGACLKKRLVWLQNESR